MFCPNCACELPAVAKFCVKCGVGIVTTAALPPLPPRALASSCIYCGKQLDPADKFCGQCGQEVTQTQTRIAKTASSIATQNFEKYAELYRQMLDDEIIRLSNQLEQLTPVAQKALIIEISKRDLKGSSETQGKTPLATASIQPRQREASADWDYGKMPDDELQQLFAAHQKLRQPVSDSLRLELDARRSRRIHDIATIPSKKDEDQEAFRLTTPVSTTAGSARVVSPAEETSAPYGAFVAQLLFFCLCASVGVYAVFDSLARNTTAFGIEAACVVLCVVAGWMTWKTRKSILRKESRNDSQSKRRLKSVVVTSLIFFVLYLGLAGLLGFGIGENRADATQLDLDLKTEKEIARRITEARSSVDESIPSYVEMYKNIEPEMVEYMSSLRKLREDWQKYEERFPAQREAARKNIAFAEKELQRSDLLTKQIAVAKEIEFLDADQQRAIWSRDMSPLLEQEDALDKTN